MSNKLRRLLLSFSKNTIPVDVFSRRYPISIKGIIVYENKVLLLKNERDEWDLPGGKIGNDASAESCLIREVKEETNLDVVVGNIIGTVFYVIRSWVKVFIVIYECELVSSITDFKLSGEHFEGRLFSCKELDDLVMLKEYKIKIKEVLK